MLMLMQDRATGTSSSPSQLLEAGRAVAALAPTDIAELFVHTTYLASALEMLREQRWLQTQNAIEKQSMFDLFVAGELRAELSSLAFLRSLMASPDATTLKRLDTNAEILINALVVESAKMEPKRFKQFASAAMLEMAKLVRAHKKLKTEFVPLYRTFDAMDQILGIDYTRDQGMRSDPHQTERLYEGAGLGVQTSYSSLLIALDEIAPPTGGQFIDLGSGYGRVGLVIGLVRPDLHFIGYEYVGHRVEVSNQCAQRLLIDDKVHFIEQDLAAKDFSIPPADVYYLYDPFTQKTYQHVFGRLREIGKSRSIAIVTKGNASRWFADAIGDDRCWTFPAHFDEGTLGLFRSCPPNPEA